MKKLHEAYTRAKPVRDALAHIGRCMEVTEDKAGIVWERWLVGKSQVVVFATPHYVEVFTPMTDATSWEDTIKELRNFAAGVGVKLTISLINQRPGSAAQCSPAAIPIPQRIPKPIQACGKRQN